MMLHRTLIIMVTCVAFVHAREPNVVFIITDNHGDWTLGCYGNKDIRTPHIDRLASGGVRFANAFANNAVCSPNRATMLTGLMPSQHGVHSFLGKGSPQVGAGAHCVIDEWSSLGEIFQQQGYRCGLVGKWHLGGNETPREGFNDHSVTMPMGSTSTFFDAEIIEGGVTRTEPIHLTQFWQREALRFLDRGDERPFFLYLAFNGPYGLGPAQEKDHERAPHWADYAQSPMTSFPRTAMHPWQFNNQDYLNNDTCIRRYAAELSTLDDAVGAVLAKLTAVGQAENTLIIFTGDNGWSGGHHGLWGMGDHTRPKCAFDPTMRVPMIWWQPGKVTPAVVSECVSHIDVFPSLLDHLGLHPSLPPTQRLTGHSYAKALHGEPLKGWDETIFYEFEDLRCLRTPQWKVVQRAHGPLNECYDLRTDPDEQHNLADHHPQPQLVERLDAHFTAMADARFDLWHGGRSLAPMLERPRGGQRGGEK
jgi:arylsulfatase A-like enzyme